MVDEEYEVDKIISQRINNSVTEYRIRWKGYESMCDTWEPEENLIGCGEVLLEFKINNGLLEDIKKDYEDGEVSESESSESGSESSIRRYKKSKKKGKKKKSHRKNLKDEEQEPDSEAANVGIKVEMPAAQSLHKEKNKPAPIQLDLTMGASSILLKAQNTYFPKDSSLINNNIGVKQENFGKIDGNLYVKEEIRDQFKTSVMPMQAPTNEDSDEETENNYQSSNCLNALIHEDDDDIDLDAELKVDIGEDYTILNTNKGIDTSLEKPLDMPTGNNNNSENQIDTMEKQESDRARQWREHLDTGTYKIRKSQKKDDLSRTNSEQVIVLAKDKWPIKPKDTLTESFYNLPVLQSVLDASIKAEAEIKELTIKEKPTKDQVYLAIEQGNNSTVWKWFITFKDVLKDGEFLLLSARVGFVDIGKMILRSGVDVNYRNEEGITSLMFACEYGHELMCHLLIVHGAHINLINKKGEGAISKAVARGHKECLIVLLQNGCDVLSLDKENDPLMMSRQRNMHEIEMKITDYHSEYTDKLTELFNNLLNNTVHISYAIFALRIVSLYECKVFYFEFNTKIPPVREDECNLLAIYSAVVSTKQLKFCLDQSVNVKNVEVNGLKQQSYFPSGSLAVTSMAPILDGKNTLRIECESTINCRWIRLMIIGYRVKLSVTAVK